MAGKNRTSLLELNIPQDLGSKSWSLSLMHTPPHCRTEAWERVGSHSAGGGWQVAPVCVQSP